MIKSIVTGFNTVASHIWLIVLPVVLDVFLWLGPQLHIQKLMSPIVEETMQVIQGINTVDLATGLDAMGNFWDTLLANFNLATLLRTFPIGIPSLLVNTYNQATPFGTPATYEMISMEAATGMGILFLIIGFIIGCFYIDQISRATAETNKPFTGKAFITEIVQAFGMTVSILLAILLSVFPILMIISVLAAVSPTIAEIVLMVIFFFAMWIIIPMLFTPHSIFSGQQNLLASVMTSVRLVRSFMPGTGLFLLIAILITQGLDILWLAPPTNSWLILVGILGHAFIYTSILAASFVYFRSGMSWMMQVIQQREKQSVQA